MTRTALATSSCAHVAAPGPRCTAPGCGHGAELHDLARDKKTRKACSIHTGPKATPCGCPAFTPEEVA